MIGGTMKKLWMRLLVVITVIVIVLSPYLLIADFERYAPFVLMVWILSIAYYLLLRKRVQSMLDNRIEENGNEEEN